MSDEVKPTVAHVGSFALAMRSRTQAAPPRRLHFSHSASVMRSGRDFISSPEAAKGLRPCPLLLGGLVVIGAVYTINPNYFVNASTKTLDFVYALNHNKGTHRKPAMIQSQLPVHFIPSSSDLLAMIKSAEQKFDVARSCALNERAERAFAINSKLIRESRKHDMRRRVNVGGAS